MSQYNFLTTKDLESQLARRRLRVQGKLRRRSQMLETLEKSWFTKGKSEEEFLAKITSSQSSQIISKTSEKKYEENDLTRLLDLYPERKWYYLTLSFNPNITWDFVQAHPEIEWDYQYLSENPNITWEIIQSTKGRPDPPGGEWDYIFLSGNPNTTWEFVQNHPEIKWDYG